MMKTIKVSEKGQIAIPRAVRDSLGINQGDELVIVQIKNKILLQKVQNVEQKIQDDFKDILKFSEQSLKEVWDNPEDEIWNTYAKRKR